jgi:hypothetical protein
MTHLGEATRPPLVYSVDMSNNAHPNGKGAAMAAFEMEVREFAREFPTPNVKLMVQLCEEGTISWAEAHKIARESLGRGLAAVAS